MNNKYIKKAKEKKVLLLIMSVCILFGLVFGHRIVKNSANETAPHSENGYGGEQFAILKTKPTQEQINEDTAKVVPLPKGDPIDSGAALIEDMNIKYIEGLRGYRYLSSESEKYFDITWGNSLDEYTLKTSDGKLTLSSIASGRWDLDEEYFFFTKHERLDTGFVNRNNIWRAKYGESEVKEIFSTGDYNNISYVSSGERLAFVTKNKVGLMNLDGSDVKYIYEFQEFNSRSGDLYVPTITYIDQNTFNVNIKLPTYFNDRVEESIEFSFK